VATLNEFPWKKGDGTRIVTISIPIILNPVINKLQGQRELSSTISEYLWLRYGENHTEVHEREIAIMMKEKQMLNDRIKELEEASLKSRELEIKNQRHSELQSDIRLHRKIRNVIYHNPNRWIWDTTLLNPSELKFAKKVVEQFGTYQKFLTAFDDWVKESEKLSIQIGEAVAKRV
jgi:DNA repair ATPase RecN